MSIYILITYYSQMDSKKKSIIVNIPIIQLLKKIYIKNI